jgi:phage-related holin
MFLSKVTIKSVLIVAALDTTKMVIMPNLPLIVWVCIMMVADLVTGLIKSKVLKRTITSEKMRHSIVKFLQYFGCIGLVMVLKNQKHDSEALVASLDWAYNGLTIFIIYIESLSVLENLYEMDMQNPFAKNVIRPLYFLLSLAVKNNPLTRLKDGDKKKDGKNPDEFDDPDKSTD